MSRQGLPRALGNAISRLCSPNSRNHLFKTSRVWGHRGMVRSLRPLPWSARNVVAPKTTCSRFSAVISDTRSPLLYIVSNSAWSRRPIQLDWSGAAMRASISGRVKYPTSFLSSRLLGIAKTRVTISILSGSRKATKRKNVRRADNRMLRERIELPRCCSRWSRKARRVGASRSATRRAEGSMPVVSLTKVSSKRKESRQLAKVWGLARLWRQRWSVKKAWIWGARGEWDALMTPLLWLHSAGTWQQQRSEVLGWRSGTNRCPEDGHVRDTPRGWATGLAHRHQPHTSGASARRRRYGVAHAGWGDVHH